MTPTRVAAAWHSVQDEWFVRLYKGKSRPWQVCIQLAKDDFVNPKVVASFNDEESAKAKAFRLENMARGRAVLAAMRALERSR